ncbi:hypothetical protein M1M40_gp27 [Halorubrum tailed virus 29]|uniref:Uncharacterized protein n=1 Tax=Halorubrum tailed virus 29 TaxID=2878010 RepID=A0AAE9BY78_9CAUD|nr:hypothetical protein M1M40_gp27 [Halorubrum tailed virus 29]UBF23305.1 hypothetical protein HRTV-29_gp27 [Halorubrum tailed virus 29]
MTDDLQHELRGLIEEWRENGIPIHTHNPHPTESAGRKAADELEQTLEEHTEADE